MAISSMSVFRRSLIALFLVVGVVGCAPNLESGDPSERKAAVLRLDDQGTLAKVATADEDLDVRKSAFEKLTDQGGLAQVAVKGKDVELRKAAFAKLADESVRALAKSERLGELAIAMAPKYQIVFIPGASGQLEKNESPTLHENLIEFRELLHGGADPGAVRILGFEPGGATPIGGSLARLSTGKDGDVVPAAKGGMTLMDFCKANGLDGACALLAAHNVPGGYTLFRVGGRVRTRQAMTAGNGASIPAGTLGTVLSIGAITDKEGQQYLVKWDGVTLPAGEQIGEKYLVGAEGGMRTPSPDQGGGL
jgi:hypothetical protein